MSIGGALGPILAGLTGYAEQQKQAEQNRIRQQEAQMRQQVFQNYLKTQQDTQAGDKIFNDLVRGGGGGGLSLGRGGLSQPQPIGSGGGQSSLPELGAGGGGLSMGPTTRTPEKGYGAGVSSLAMAESPEIQEAVAKKLATTDGVQHWANFNPKLKSALEAAGLPTSGPVSEQQWGQVAPLLKQYESAGGQNVPNYRFDATHTAGGPFQITNQTWRGIGGPEIAARMRGQGGAPQGGGGSDLRAQYDAWLARYGQTEGQYGPGHYNSGQGAVQRPAPETFEQYKARFADRGGSGSTGPTQPDAGAGDEDGGGGGDAGDGATVPMAQIEVTPAEKKEAKQLEVKVAQLVDPMARGKMSLEGLMKTIDKANPNASEHAKRQALEKYYKEFLAPEEQERRREDLQRLRDAATDERQRRLFEQQDKSFDRRQGAADDRADKRTRDQAERDAKRDVELFEDAEGNEHYLQKGKDVPKGWRKAGTGGASASKGREGDIAGEIRRKDEAYLQQHPDATPAQKQEAHFKHRKDAEQELAGATTHTRSGQAKFAQEWAEAHPGHTDQEFSNAMAGYTADQAIARNFAGGSGANQMRSLNTAAGHLSRLREYAEALQTGDIPRVNQLLQAISRETGHSEVTNFELARDITADEVVRLLTSTGGTEADRQGMQSRIKAASSPEQMVGAMDVMDQFVGERFKGLEQSYARGDQKKSEFFREKMLIPEAQRMFTRADRGRGAQPAPGGGQPGAAPSGAKYSVGQIIEHGGKKYRVTGGSPDDPDLEPVQ